MNTHSIPNLLLHSSGCIRLAHIPYVDNEHEHGRIAVLAVNYHDRCTVRKYQKVHPDTLRCNALQQIVRLPVFGVANFRSDKSPLAMIGDIRSTSTWATPASFAKRGSKVDSITTRQAKVVILDYYWLPGIYLDANRNRDTNGYGNLWVKKLIPLAFQNGVKVVILPNDSTGRISAMVHTDGAHLVRAGGGVSKLTLADAFLYNPLFRATQAAINTEGWSNSVYRNNEHRTNALAWRKYLNPIHPFFMFYNKNANLQDAGVGKRYLLSLYRKPTAVL
jgi:hypothetical protein